MNELLKFINDKNFISVHSFTLYTAVVMMVHSYIWACQFAYAALDKGLSSVDIGAIILAVTAPVSALTKYSYDIYSASRK